MRCFSAYGPPARVYQSLVCSTSPAFRPSWFFEFACSAQLGVEHLNIERRPTGPDYSVALTDFGAIQHLVGQLRRIVGVDPRFALSRTAWLLLLWHGKTSSR